jgi:hemerythrin-like domain-containing protein
LRTPFNAEDDMDKDLLARHHEELERRIAVLLTKADGGDSHDLWEEWCRFEHELLRHLDLEEREVFPRFRREHAEATAALLEEHSGLRRDLLALGIRADLHSLRADAVRAFVDQLHAHAVREEQLLYPWAKDNLHDDTWETITESLRAAGRFVSRRLTGLATSEL